MFLSVIFFVLCSLSLCGFYFFCLHHPCSSGAMGATSGDSFECRNYHAGVASGSAALAVVHCTHTSALSADSVCAATTCDVYCDSIASVCSGSNAQYSSRGMCMTACAALPQGSQTHACTPHTLVPP
jgi:hypothetical protein